MGWLVAALLAGVAIGLRFRLSPKTLRLLDHTVTASLVAMLMGFGIQVGGNPKLNQTLDKHSLTVFALLAGVSLASLLWGWLMERGWSLLWRQG